MVQYQLMIIAVAVVHHYGLVVVVVHPVWDIFDIYLVTEYKSISRD